MPLKHPVETFLVFLLGLVIALTGLVLKTLPPLSEGYVPWVIVFAATIIYPLLFSSLYKKRRADYSFRLLHWLPALMALIWLALQLGSRLEPSAESAFLAFSWGWTLPAVFVGFVLLVAYCLNVIRRRGKRVALLLLIFAPYTVLAVMSEQGREYDKELASVLWNGDWWREMGTPKAGTGETVAQVSSDANYLKSEDPSEEEWRERLRAIERRRMRIAEQMEEREGEKMMEEDADSDGMMEEEKDEKMMEDTMEKEPPPDEMAHYGQSSSKPTSLPKSGAGAAGVALAFFAGYMGTLQKRARDRA